MKQLKTDYKDAMFDGARKYRISQNPDGTSGIADETTYTQKGDSFGANDINGTNETINALMKTRTLTLTAAGWQGEGPYTQTVKAGGIQDTDEPVAKEQIPKSATKENEKAIRKAAACVSYFETGNGTVTFTCIGKKPATDFQVVVKGV